MHLQLISLDIIINGYHPASSLGPAYPRTLSLHLLTFVAATTLARMSADRIHLYSRAKYRRIPHHYQSEA